ncbi:Tricarboxylate transport protein TctC [plant metagenome]|uniref:Tricarboxylate transport protein TctC n=1 Tax=plant metagenome TaxID=1297885 RepID=A0A484QCA4_9ZZZZ
MSFTSFARPLAAVVLGLCAAQPAWAAYPERPIKYVLSSGAGSAPDTLMRMVLQEVGQRMGATFVVENRSGAAGLLAMQAIANAEPDGYTVGHGNTQTLGISPSLSPQSATAAQRVDLIVQVGYTANLLSVRPGLPVDSVQSLIDYAKAHPGKLVYASAGNGTSGHVGAELFREMSGIEIVHAPYRSAPAGVNDVMAGHVDMVFDNMAGSLPFAKEGKLKALAVTSAQRSPLIPELPTVSEAGVKGFEVTAWSGVIAPKGVPADRIEAINRAVNAVLKEPRIIQGMRDLGYEVAGGTSQSFTDMVLRERAKWAGVIKSSGASID